MSKPKYINVYETLPQQKKKTYPNYPEVQIDLPCRAIFCGPSGSGKTNAVHNFVRLIDHWDTIVVIAKNLDQPIFNELKERAQAAEKRRKRRIWAASNKLSDLPDMEDWDPKDNNLIIIDDFIGATKKELEPVGNYFTECRHKNVSICFLTQSYYATPSMIRKNANIIVLKQIASMGDMKRILKEYSLTVKPEKAIDMYEKSIAVDPDEEGELGAHVKHWFTMDPNNINPDLRFRKNFDPIPASYWKPKK
jgi:hypothetical protein